MVLRWQAPPRLQAVCDPRLRPARQGRRPGRPVRRNLRPRRGVRARDASRARDPRGRRRQPGVLPLRRPLGVPRHGRLPAARLLAGRALAADHMADGEPVGLRPLAAAEDRRRRADLQPVRRLPPGRVVVLRTLIAAGLVAAGVAGAQPQSGLVVGHSVRGRGIVAYERGDRSAPVTLVFGVIHGTEPENRATRAFILRIKPALTIWYHQPLGEVYGSDPHVSVLKRYARLTGLRYRRLAAPRGAATRWERERFPRGPHFVVEFPAGPISAATARRHAAAVVALAKALVP